MNLSALPPELLPAILEQLPHLVWLAKPDGYVDYINAYGREYLGVEMDQLRGWSWMQIIHPADREPTLHAWIEATTLGETLQIRYRMLESGRRYRWNIVSARPIRNSAGEVVVYVGTCTDVDDWKQSLRDLSSANREIEELLAVLNVFENKAPVGFGFVDRELRYRRINGNLATINGIKVREHLGRTVREVLPRLWPVLAPLFQSVLETRQPIVEQEASGETPASPGEIRHWIVSFYPVQVADELAGVAMIVVETDDGGSLHLHEPEVTGKAMLGQEHRPSSAA